MRNIYLKIFLIFIFLYINAYSFDDTVKNSENENSKSIQIQIELDKLYLQLRTSRVTNLTCLYIPEYGVVVQFNYNVKIAFPYGSTSNTAKEHEKQNYMEVASLFNFVAKKIIAIPNIKSNNNILVCIKTQNMFVQRKISYNSLKTIYSKSAELNIVQSIIKFESDPESAKNRILKEVEENLVSTIFAHEKDNINPIYKTFQNIYDEIKKEFGVEIVASYLPDFGILINIVNPKAFEDENITQTFLNVSACIKKDLKIINLKSSERLLIALRKKNNEIIIEQTTLKD